MTVFATVFPVTCVHIHCHSQFLSYYCCNYLHGVSSSEVNTTLRSSIEFNVSCFDLTMSQSYQRHQMLLLFISWWLLFFFFVLWVSCGRLRGFSFSFQLSESVGLCFKWSCIHLISNPKPWALYSHRIQRQRQCQFHHYLLVQISPPSKLALD